jgi:hypothetical protein
MHQSLFRNSTFKMYIAKMYTTTIEWGDGDSLLLLLLLLDLLPPCSSLTPKVGRRGTITLSDDR